ncbi:hypothetical protein HMPREF1433_00931 [Helicobacter pylori GAMchJs117Ai]|nr:hypothetical protein HMPREF1433_00931 [Helicobacter pylori GAMchJs117Ai]
MISKYPPIFYPLKEISFCHKTMKTKQPKPRFLKKLKSFSY